MEAVHFMWSSLCSENLGLIVNFRESSVFGGAPENLNLGSLMVLLSSSAKVPSMFLQRTAGDIASSGPVKDYVFSS